MALVTFTPGQVLTAQDLNDSFDASGGSLKKITATTVSATTISVNNCFSADYDNYLVRFVGHASNLSDVTLRFRVGGVDEAGGSAYQWGRIFVGATASTTLGSTNAQTGSSITLSNILSTAGNTGIIDLVIASPYKAVWSTVISLNAGHLIHVGGGALKNTTVYDGFSLLGTNLTGTLTVYGYEI